jgi:rhodanese-related sulfurtransferase
MVGNLQLEVLPTPGHTPEHLSFLVTDTPATQVVDVRDPAGWEAGHRPGVPNIPLAHLAHESAALSRDRPVVVHCQGGGRSAIAASPPAAHGFRDVRNLSGGIVASRRAGLPTQHARGESVNG